MLRQFMLRLLMLCLVCLQGVAPLVHAHVQGGAEHSGVHMHTGWQSTQTEAAFSSPAWSQDAMLAVGMESGVEGSVWHAPHLPGNYWLTSISTVSVKLSPATSAPHGPPDIPLFPSALSPPLSH